MASARSVFKPAAIVMVVGGALLCISSVYIFLGKNNYAYGALQGLLMVLFMVIIGGFEAASARPVYRTEQGSWRNSLLLTGLSALLKLFTALTAFSVYDRMSPKEELVIQVAWACVIVLLAEVVVVVLFLVFRRLFMPSEDEVQASMKKLGGVSVKTVSECPRCRELVEKDWAQCPQCGTRLPRLCANCGYQLPVRVEKCPSCGTLVERPESVRKTIATMKELSEEEARPEARSVRFARLAEAYLKAGETNEALESYRRAIHYTEFDRKRANFMVKMANILDNEGRDREANEILDAALQMDPEDEAGAAALKRAIEVKGLAAKAKGNYERGENLAAEAKARSEKGEKQAALDLVEQSKSEKQAALDLVEQVLAKDDRDLNGVGWIKAESLVAKAEGMVKAKAPKEETLRVLEEAVRLDPYSRTKALSMYTSMAPKEKRKKNSKT